MPGSYPFNAETTIPELFGGKSSYGLTFQVDQLGSGAFRNTAEIDLIIARIGV